MSMLLTKALNLGVIDTALNWLIDAVTTLLMWIVNWTIDLVLTLFAGILYEIGLTLLSIVDFFQAFFNALCGLGTYWTTESDGKILEHPQEDPLLNLVTNKAVLQVFLALAIVALVLLIMTTVIAMIRTEYTTEGAKNTKGNIIGTALKSLAMFFLVPAFCVFGIILSNTLLQMVYIATSGGDNVTAGAMVWYASSYNANRVRLDQEFYNEHWGTSADDNDSYSIDFKVQGQGSAEQRETVAGMIDLAFKNGTPINKNSEFINTGSMSESVLDFINGDDGLRAEKGLYSYRNVGLTREFYELKEMNFIVMYLGGGIAVYIMFIAAFGLIIRMYKCAVLFMVSAPIQALTPLDGGNAFKNWRKLMIGSVCSAFSVVIAFNLMFLLIPVMGNINIFNPGAGYTVQFWNRLVNMIFVLTGLYSIKETSKWVANMLGIEDPLAAGSEIAGKVMGTVSKVATVAGTAGIGMATNVLKSGVALSSKIAHNTGHGKASKVLDSIAHGKDGKGGLAAFSGKMSGMAGGIVGKTITKQMNRFDDFAGGANVFGGVDSQGNPTGLGALMSQGAKTVISGAIKTPGALVGVGGEALRRRITPWTSSEEQENKRNLARMESLEQRRLSRGNQTYTEEEANEFHRLQTATENFKKKHKGTIREGISYVNDNDEGAQHWANIRSQGGTFTEMQNEAKKYKSDVEQDVSDALRAAAMYEGGLDSEKGLKAAESAIESLCKKLGMTFDQVKKSLQEDGGKSLKDQAAKPLQILNDYHATHDVNINGFDPATVVFDSRNMPSTDDQNKIVETMLTAQGIQGENLKQQFNAVYERLRADQQKLAEEVKKETDKMLQQASLIAKQMKILNPTKK